MACCGYWLCLLCSSPTAFSFAKWVSWLYLTLSIQEGESLLTTKKFRIISAYHDVDVCGPVIGGTIFRERWGTEDTDDYTSFTEPSQVVHFPMHGKEVLCSDLEVQLWGKKHGQILGVVRNWGYTLLPGAKDS